MKKKNLLIPVIASLVTVLVLSGVSYAYYSAKIKENNKTETVIKTNELNLIFTGTNEITANNMIPGDSFTKTFTVENTSNRAVDYNIYMENITNEFNEDLVYTLEDTTGSVISETSLPVTNKDKSYLKTAISIEAKTIKTYTLKITFKNTEEPQNDYQGKTFKGTLGIDANKVETTPEVKAISFADDSWTTIQKAVQSGTYPYQVGDSKTIDMGKFGTHTLRVANTSACTTETSETACGFVVEFADIITTHNMNSTATNVGGWPASELRTYINDTIYKTLPTDLQNVIVNTAVVSSHGSTEGEENFISSDKLYLLSTKEVWGKENWGKEETSKIISEDTSDNETRQLDYYKNLGVTSLKSYYSGAIKQYNGFSNEWWLRSATADYYVEFFFVNSAGEWDHGKSGYNYGVSPSFRIA